MAPRRRERWYSLDGQRRNHRAALESTHGPRRLLSLVVLLVLTLIMIQQVSDVKRVAHVATSIGLLPPAGNQQPPPDSQIPTANTAHSSAPASSKSDSAMPGTMPGNSMPDKPTSGDLSRRTEPASTSPQGPVGDAEQSGLSPTRDANGRLAQTSSTFDSTFETITDTMQRDIATLTLHHPAAIPQLQSEVLQRLLQSAPKPVQESMIAAWLELSDAPPPTTDNPQSAERSAVNPSEASSRWLEKSLGTLQRWIELTDSTQPEHQVLVDLSRSLPWLLQSSQSHFIQPDSTVPSEVPFRDVVRLSLDRILLQSFLDNTPWRTGERLALARTTQRAALMQQAFQGGWLAPSMIPGASIPLLVSQTSTLRGRGVRVSGTVARVDPPVSLSLAKGIDMQYRVLWLRPQDASNQPIVIHLSDTLPVSPELLELNCDISVTGLLAKRRAYASDRGGEVAPVLIAADITPSPPAGLRPQPLTASQRSALPSWSSAQQLTTWIPPRDLQSPLRLVQERLGPRLASLPPPPSVPFPDFDSLPTHDSSPAWFDAMHGFALSEATLATLLGLQKFSEEVNLLTQSQNRFPLGDDQVLSEWSGWVTQVTPIAIEQPPFPGFDWKVIYAIRLAQELPRSPDSPGPSAPSHTIIALTHQVPTSWLTPPSLRQPCIVRGLGLLPNRTSSATEPYPNHASDLAAVAAPSVVLCASVAWQFAESHSMANKSLTDSSVVTLAPPLPFGWQSLLENSWDLAWIDLLESLHGQPMTSRESTPFYAMLAASNPPSGRSTPMPHPTGEPPDSQPLTMMAAIQRSEASKRKKGSVPDSERSVGYRVKSDVIVRRVQRIEVSDPNRTASLGSNAYFQIDGLADIGRNRIEIKYGPELDPVVFQGEFPVTMVATHVPEWLLIESGDADPSGSQVWYPRIRTVAEGWFYRIWRYKTPQISAATDDTQSQQGPMLIVDRIEMATAVPNPTSQPDAMPWSSIAATLLGLVAIAWFSLRMQRQPGARARLQKHSFKKPPSNPGRS